MDCGVLCHTALAMANDESPRTKLESREDTSSESSCSDEAPHSYSTSTSVVPKAGDASPSTIQTRRRLSTVLCKSFKSRHPVFGGRHALLVSSPTKSSTHLKKEYCLPPTLPEPSKPTFASMPPALRSDAWSEPGAATFAVRGANYISDKKKISSLSAAFPLLAVDFVNSDQPLLKGLCAHPNERVQRALQRERETGVQELPEFILAVNLCIPGANKTYHQVSYFGIDNLQEIKNASTPFDKLMNRFLFEDDDDFRNRTFKLIPRIVEGNYIVRKAVGTKPSIIGKKIKQYYIRSDRYMEMIVDISSDSIAQRIVKLALGFARTLVTDIMYVLEGNSCDTLPERIFGGVQLRGIDLHSRDGQRTVREVNILGC
jgi:hypothetical protein